jgi:ATP/ADP translocase
MLEQQIPDKDLRTEYSGRILGIVNLTTTALQCFGTFLLVHFLGLRGSHFFIPLTLCLNACSYLIFPFFGTISFCYVSIKSFDFSVFGVVKEMLYIPLKVDEKFRAKAVIDVFAYRSCKAFAALLILSFQALRDFPILPVLTVGCIGIFLLWAFVVFKLFKQYDPVAEIS